MVRNLFDDRIENRVDGVLQARLALLRPTRWPRNLYTYATSAIDMATPYVSARAAATAPITLHGSAWAMASQNLMALQTSDGVTLISPQRVVDEGRSLAPPASSSCRERIYSRRCRIQLFVCDKTLEVSADPDDAGNTEVEFKTMSLIRPRIVRDRTLRTRLRAHASRAGFSAPLYSSS